MKAGDKVIYKCSVTNIGLGLRDGDKATVLCVAHTPYADAVFVYFHKWENEKPVYEIAQDRVQRFGMPAYKLLRSDFIVEARCMFNKEVHEE